MSIVDNVISKVNKLPKGYVFTVDDFNTKVGNREATVKALNRMVAAGKIAKRIPECISPFFW